MKIRCEYHGTCLKLLPSNVDPPVAPSSHPLPPTSLTLLRPPVRKWAMKLLPDRSRPYLQPGPSRDTKNPLDVNTFTSGIVFPGLSPPSRHSLQFPSDFREKSPVTVYRNRLGAGLDSLIWTEINIRRTKMEGSGGDSVSDQT